MAEAFGWAVGLLIGLTYARPFSSRVRAVLFLILLVAFGAGMTFFSGEWMSEPAFVFVDIGQVALATLIGSFIRRQLFARRRATGSAAKLPQ